MENLLEKQLKNYCLLLEQVKVKEYPNCEMLHYKYTYSVGKKYIRIIQCNHVGRWESAFCFVDFEGNLYKTAGWNKPAPDIRGHISKPILDLGGFYK